MKSMVLRCALILMMITVVSFAQEVGTPAPDFSGKTGDGKDVKLSDYQGKVVLLDFWASWCAPCLKEMPFLVEFYEQNQDAEFMVIAINIDDKAANMNKFLQKLKTGVPFSVIHDAQKVIPPLYNPEAMPTTVFIDKKGIIRYRHTGFKDSYKEEFAQELATLLAEAGDPEK